MGLAVLLLQRFSGCPVSCWGRGRCRVRPLGPRSEGPPRKLRRLLMKTLEAVTSAVATSLPATRMMLSAGQGSPALFLRTLWTGVCPSQDGGTGPDFTVTVTTSQRTRLPLGHRAGCVARLLHRLCAPAGTGSGTGTGTGSGSGSARMRGQGRAQAAYPWMATLRRLVAAHAAVHGRQQPAFRLPPSSDCFSTWTLWRD